MTESYHTIATSSVAGIAIQKKPILWAKMGEVGSVISSATRLSTFMDPKALRHWVTPVLLLSENYVKIFKSNFNVNKYFVKPY